MSFFEIFDEEMKAEIKMLENVLDTAGFSCVQDKSIYKKKSEYRTWLISQLKYVSDLLIECRNANMKLDKENRRLSYSSSGNTSNYHADEHSVLSELTKINEMLECSLNHAHEENKELKKKLNGNRMLRTLEQYERDDRENISTIQIFTDLARKQENEIEQLKTELCKQREYKSCRTQALQDAVMDLRDKNEALINEIKIYKEFFANNQVNVVLKEDKT